MTGIKSHRSGAKDLFVIAIAKHRASRSLSARTMIGSGLHFFQIGSVGSVGVSFQMRMMSSLFSTARSIVRSNGFNYFAEDTRIELPEFARGVRDIPPENR
jgi:hypothetical protein